MRRLLIITCLCLSLLVSGLADERKAEFSELLAKGCVVYYGAEPQDKSQFENHQVIILESSHWSTRSLQDLRNQGKTVIAYLSVGETTAEDRELFRYSTLSENEHWQTVRVDPSDPVWREDVLRRTRLARSRGVDGLMLDTVDITSVHPEAEEAMSELIRDVRKEMPQRFLMINRGFSILGKVASSVDAVLFENANDSRFSPHDQEWVLSVCHLLQRVKMPVLLLDYQGHSELTDTENMADTFGWSYYVAPSVSLSSILSCAK